jgi:hypothetical protein
MTLPQLRILFVAIAVALVLAIVWAMLTGGPLFPAVARVAAEPWGAVLLLDLYAGFAAATALFFLVERRGVAVALFIALMILGNVVTLLWLTVRGWSALSARRD